MAAQDIDLHLIELKYAHTRVLDRKTVFAVMRSLDRYGQITPITVIPDASSFILIDGYVRVAALTKLGRDTVLCVVQDMPEQTALLHVLAGEARRPFHPLEQAGLILEIRDRFGLSLRSIAKGLGQDASWVKRRLDLIQSLPENVLDLVRAGHICLWSASRILAPLARANHNHAMALSQYLLTHPLSTRELQTFFKAYQKATRKAREAMVHNPGLFLKAKDHQDELKSLQGPEKTWFSDMKMVCSIVRRLGPRPLLCSPALGTRSGSGSKGFWLRLSSSSINWPKRPTKESTMLSPQERETIRQMHAKKVSIKDICRLMKLSRNTVRKVLRDDGATGSKESKHLEHLGLIKDLLHRCRGNVVRVRECLEDEHGISIPYTTLTWLVRSFELAEPKKKRSGRYVFAKGQEMQHDTSPFKLMLGSSNVQTQCASLVLAYSRKLSIQFYPRFTRFEAKEFLTKAFVFMQGICPRCVVDNTSVLVSVGTGSDAVIAPEMEAFGRFFQLIFTPHKVGDPNRKARVERPFDYISRNFLAGRTFTDFNDLNTQALVWCETVANAKIKRALGMSANEAYLLEKPALIPLPEHVPEVFVLVHRVVDSEGFVHLETNRYSVPEKLVGTNVEVYKFWDRVEVYAGHTKVARHPRALKPGRSRVTDPAHHPPIKPKVTGPSQEERLLSGHSQALDSYVAGLRKRSRGRGVQPLRRLLTLKRTYPEDSFLKAVERAKHYHMYDLRRLEDLILSMVAGDFFDL